MISSCRTLPVFCTVSSEPARRVSSRQVSWSMTSFWADVSFLLKNPSFLCAWHNGTSMNFIKIRCSKIYSELNWLLINFQCFLFFSISQFSNRFNLYLFCAVFLLCSFAFLFFPPYSQFSVKPSSSKFQNFPYSLTISFAFLPLYISKISIKFNYFRLWNFSHLANGPLHMMIGDEICSVDVCLNNLNCK